MIVTDRLKGNVKSVLKTGGARDFYPDGLIAI